MLKGGKAYQIDVHLICGLGFGRWTGSPDQPMCNSRSPTNQSHISCHYLPTRRRRPLGAPGNDRAHRAAGQGRLGAKVGPNLNQAGNKCAGWVGGRVAVNGGAYRTVAVGDAAPVWKVKLPVAGNRH